MENLNGEVSPVATDEEENAAKLGPTLARWESNINRNVKDAGQSFTDTAKSVGKHISDHGGAYGAGAAALAAGLGALALAKKLRAKKAAAKSKKD